MCALDDPEVVTVVLLQLSKGPTFAWCYDDDPYRSNASIPNHVPILSGAPSYHPHVDLEASVAGNGSSGLVGTWMDGHTHGFIRLET